MIFNRISDIELQHLQQKNWQYQVQNCIFLVSKKRNDSLFVRVPTFAVRQLVRVSFADSLALNHEQKLGFGLRSSEKLLHLSLVTAAMEARSSCEAAGPIHVQESSTIRLTIDGTKR